MPFFPECVARVPVSLWGSGGEAVFAKSCVCGRNRRQPSATVCVSAMAVRLHGKCIRSGLVTSQLYWRLQRRCLYVMSVPHKSVKQECFARVSSESVPTRVSRKCVKSDCSKRVSSMSVLQECQVSVSYKSVKKACQVSVSCQSVKSVCHVWVSHNDLR